MLRIQLLAFLCFLFSIVAMDNFEKLQLVSIFEDVPIENIDVAKIAVGSVFKTPKKTRFHFQTDTDPTLTPTAAPTLEEDFSLPPTRSPTESSELPAEPTASPTETPTETPTDSPSAIPSMIPTMTPSTIPTELPTEAPTHSPSVIPTVTPTIYPSVIPSTLPSEVPSEAPTLAPSEAPTDAPFSSVPTRVPTAAPSTRRPTQSPVTLAPASTPVQGVSFSAATQMTISAASFNADTSNKLAVQLTVQSLLGVSSGVVVGDAYTPTSRRSLLSFNGVDSSSPRRLRLSTLTSTSNRPALSGNLAKASESCAVPFSVTIADTTALGYTDAAVAFSSINSLLSNATTSGTFTSTLQTYAQTLNASSLATVEVAGFVPATSYDTIVVDSGHHSKGLTTANVSGIVIGGVLFIGIILSVYFYYAVYRERILSTVERNIFEEEQQDAHREWYLSSDNSPHNSLQRIEDLPPSAQMDYSTERRMVAGVETRL